MYPGNESLTVVYHEESGAINHCRSSDDALAVANAIGRKVTFLTVPPGGSLPPSRVLHFVYGATSWKKHGVYRVYRIFIPFIRFVRVDLA